MVVAVLVTSQAHKVGAQPIHAADELAQLASKLATLEAYAVRVAIRLSDARDGAVSQVVRLEAWRDGKEFAYRSGPVEVLWLTRGVVVVNHASRTIMLKEPAGQEEGLAELAAKLSYQHLSNAAANDVTASDEANGRRFIVQHARGPLLRTELLLDKQSQLPSSALLVYRPAMRLPGHIAIAYDWTIGKPSGSILDHRRFLVWEEGSVGLQSTFSSYTLIRLDRVQ
jgi:hypothetical protein